MGIFDFDWMDFNHDGKVDDLERAFGFSILEEEDRLSRNNARKNLWDPYQDDDSDFDSASGDDDGWL